jgi:hypothetical protein
VGRTLLSAAFEFDLDFTGNQQLEPKILNSKPTSTRVSAPRQRMALSWYYPAGTAVILAMWTAAVTFEPMTIVLMMVVLAFGLLYVAVVAEERQMQEATKPRKR